MANLKSGETIRIHVMFDQVWAVAKDGVVGFRLRQLHTRTAKTKFKGRPSPLTYKWHTLEFPWEEVAKLSMVQGELREARRDAARVGRATQAFQRHAKQQVPEGSLLSKAMEELI